MFILTTRLSMLRPPDLMTAEILYHLPDYPALLQSFVWQDYDIAPNYPTLRRFLGFWEREIDAKLHSVTVASRQLTYPFNFETVGSEYRLH
ncbi:MAG: hypothetical protein V4621_01220 [Pseudomonadota bacterium]